MSGELLSRRSLLAAGVVLVATGCARVIDPNRGQELMWATGGIGAADRDSGQDVVAQWNALHPNRPRVRVEPLSQSTNEQRQLLALELNAGLRELDILTLDLIWIPEFAKRRWIVDLDELRPQIERVSLPGPVHAGVWDGTLWAAPFVTDAGILYYRSDLVDSPPNTWEELIDVGRRVGTQHGIAPFVADGAQYEGLVVQYLEYFWGLGGEVLSSDGQAVLFEPDKALQAIEFMRKAFREGVYAPGFDTMDLEAARKTFQSGEAVFMRSWPYAYQQMNGGDPSSQIAGKFSIAPLPAFTGHGPVTALGGHNHAVSVFSRNIPAAMEFVRMAATSRDVQLGQAQRHSLAPSLRAVYRDLGADPMMELLAKVLPTAKSRPATPEWATISAEMQQQIFAAYTGDQDPRAAVQALRSFLVAMAERS